jgi:pyruvate, water dikinase
MVNIAWFKDISKDSIALVGGKGANLGELSRNNFPVPNGFVVTADSYKLFLAQTKIQDQIDKILAHLDIEDSNKLNEASERVQDLILSSDMPYEVKLDIQKAYKNINIGTDITTLPAQAANLVNSGRDTSFVAVRSSATAEDLPTASFAGQQSTYLNVRGLDNVTKAVHQCWASLYTPRAIYYREKNDFEHSKVFIAVVIQKMINSEKSGVIFTMNPVTNDENEIIIEAGYGLGDAIVSGAISPNRYVVEKDYWKLKDKKIPGQEWMFGRDVNTGRTVKIDLSEGKSKRQVLEDDEIIVIAKLAAKIEKHYKKPQDIEYAIENNRLYIVQSRAVTTKEKVEEVKEEEIEGDVILEGLSASPGVGSGTVKIVDGREELHKIEKGDVLVAKMTSPDMVPAMERASAIVTNEGGTTCHAAIVSRELGIPCVVGTEKATEVLSEGSVVTVDGSSGKVYSGEKEVEEPEKIEMDIEVSNEKTVTKVKVNVDISQAVGRAVETNPDGVGLARLEFVIAEKGIHPLKYVREGREEEYTNYLVEKLKEIAQPFGERPVWVRTSDIRSDEYDELEGGDLVEKESNPMMGWHGIRMSLDEKKLLKAELKAIRRLRQEGIRNISIMIPLVTHVNQVEKVKEIMSDLDLDCDLGIMIETPAAVEIIDDLCSAGIKFASIGSNDLTQFTLAVDRNNEKVAELFSELHPAVLKQIRRVIKKCREYNVESSICGQAGSNEEMVKKLVKYGISSISANVDAVGKIRNIVSDEERRLLESARDNA